MRAIATALLLLLALAPRSLAAGTPRPPSAAPLIDAVLDAYGGRPALAKVKSYRMEGVLQATDPRGEARFTRLLERPSRLAVTLSYATGPERRLFDGAQGWRTIASGAVEPVGGFLLDSMVLQAARSGVPWLFHD